MNDASALTVHDVPYYPEIPSYVNFVGMGMHIWEGDGWKAESLSWKTGCYLGSNISGLPEVTYSGPDAQQLLSRLHLNNVFNWPVGKSKHLVALDENGLVANHGLAVRDGEQSFRQLCALPWPIYKAPALGLDVEISARTIFVFQVAGPTSLQVLERLLDRELRDLAFLAVQPISIPGIPEDVELEVSRLGMVGTLAYEVRGPIEHGPKVYDAIYKAGQPFGITRLGWRTYVVNHTEGGFPQLHCTFQPSAYLDQDFVEQFMFASGGSHRLLPGGPNTGSIDPADSRARLRTACEVNWDWMAKFDHDFIGRQALEAEIARPKRKTVTLRWNKADIMDVFASQFEPGEEYRNFEFPTTPQQMSGGHADLVTKDGVDVGVSSVAVYSYSYREMLSHSTLDVGLAEIGNEVIVHWGDHGGRIKPIRATVERFPYLEMSSNKDFDLSTIPSGIG